MKLASLEKILEILPHPNADKLELAKVLGYTCIVVKDSFKVGETCVLIQPDTVLPDKPWAEVFKKKSGRVKAVKLRGQWSFGIVLKTHVFGVPLDSFSVGEDISRVIEVIKYEPPVPQQLDALGLLPTGLGKTDEERWQNLELPFGETADVTLKVDGSSMTVYCKLIDGVPKTGICSRSLELKPECVNKYTTAVQKFDLIKKLTEYCLTHNVSLALRGEIYGNGIQSHGANPHAKLPLGFAAFSVYNLDTLEYEEKGSKHYYQNVCTNLDVEQVLVVERDATITQELVKKYSEDISQIDGKPFEGVVIKHKSGSFKIINLAYDEKK
jgi:RNA ligase (TIGR02306 family)